MKYSLCFFVLLISFTGFSQERMAYDNPELQAILKSDNAVVCLEEFLETEPEDIEVIKKTVENELIVSDYYQLRSYKYYQSFASGKRYVEMIIQQDFFVANDFLTFFNCTVNK